MKKNKEVIVNLITFLIVLCLGAGIIGILINNKIISFKVNIIDSKPTYTLKYVYYIDNSLQKSVINESYFDNQSNDKIVYSKHSCTNGVEGTWNPDTYSLDMAPLTINTVCSIYYNKLSHKISFSATNGSLTLNEGQTLEDINPVDVELSAFKTIKFTPNVGYKFDKISCGDTSIVADYKNETNELTISNVTKNSNCSINFAIGKFTVNVETSNAEVKEKTKSANYGETLFFNITPSENYEYSSLSCTNNQIATFENNQLKITGLSNDTTCIVQFKIKKFTVKTTVVNGSLLSTTPSIQTTTEGKNVSFSVTQNTGYVLTDATVQCSESTSEKNLFENGLLTIYGVKADTTCTITLKEAASNE